MLEDSTGKRGRRLRLLGRLVAIVLTLWLVTLILGGVGLHPVPGVPFSGALHPSISPPDVKRLPTPKSATAADLRPARPAAAPRTKGFTPVERRQSEQRRQAVANKRAAAPVVRAHIKQPAKGAPLRPVTIAPTSPNASPQAGTSHPNNGKHTGANNSPNGSSTTTTTTTSTTTTTTTTPGRSGSAPGHTGTTPGGSRANGATTP